MQMVQMSIYVTSIAKKPILFLLQKLFAKVGLGKNFKVLKYLITRHGIFNYLRQWNSLKDNIIH